MEKALIRHLKDHLGLYLVVIVFFLAGIIAGAVSVHFLEPDQVIQLATYLDNILQQFKATGSSAPQAAYQALGNAVKEIGLIWFLGLTVIGIPLIITFIFLKGFILGFTVGFLVEQKAFSGVAFSFLAILPPNLIHIPALFLAAIMGLSFSITLLRGRNGQENFFKGLLSYSFSMFLVTFAIMAGGLVEVYLSPVFARVVLNYF